MCPWKGRGKGIRVFIKGKPHRNGIKIYLLADRSGYVFDFWIYRGTQPSTKDIVVEFADALPGTYLLLHQNCVLIIPKGTGFILTFDAYYGGFEIAQELRTRSLYFIASCTVTRPSFLFKDHLHKKLEENEERGARAWCSWRRRFLAVAWRDKKILNLLTNCHDRPRTRHMETDKNGEEIRVPQVVEDYRASLNYVDRANSYRLRYYFWHRVIKHTRVQFINMVLLCVVNAWILYTYINSADKRKRVSKPKLSYKQFFVQLIKELAERGGFHRDRKREAAPPSAKEAHIVIRTKQRGTCAYCKVQGSTNRGNCNTKCSSCDLFLHADTKNCFARHHKLDPTKYE